jgi:hypothetical protein
VNTEEWVFERFENFDDVVVAARNAAIDTIEQIDAIEGSEKIGIECLAKIKEVDAFQELYTKFHTGQSGPLTLPQARNSSGPIEGLYMLECGNWTALYGLNFEDLTCVGLKAIEGRENLKRHLESL